MVKQRRISKSDDDTPDTDTVAAEASIIPKETPEWGIKLLELLESMHDEFRSVTRKTDLVEEAADSNTKSIKSVKKKLAKVEKRNAALESENIRLKEKLLELDYQQRKNNLIFDGIFDGSNESDLNCISKLCFVLKDVPDLDVQHFKIDKCYHLDGPFKRGPDKKGAMHLQLVP